MNHLFLNSALGEDSEIPLISITCAPSGSGSNSLYGLTIIHLVIPLFGLLPLIKWPKVNVGCLFVDFIWICVDFRILLIVILILDHSLGSQEETRVVQRGHRAAEVVVDGQVPVEVLVAEIHIDGGELSLAAEDDSAAKVPREDAVVAVDGESLVLAVGVEGVLGDNVDELIDLVGCDLVNCVVSD